MRNPECGIAHKRAPELRDDALPHVFARMEWYPRQHRDPELDGELVRGIPHERAADHVLDHAEQGGLPLDRGAERPAYRVPRLEGRNGHGEHGGCYRQQLTQLLEALHTGWEIHEQLVEGAPGHVGQELAQRRGLQGPPPNMRLSLRPAEGERSAILEEKC